MAAQNRLRASIDDSHDDYLEEIVDQRDTSRPEAERTVVKEGLVSLGYIPKPTEAHELLLYYVRRIGLTLGFGGLAVMGYGVFGSRIFSLIGFGLTLGGFLLVALEEFLDFHSDQMDLTVRS